MALFLAVLNLIVFSNWHHIVTELAQTGNITRSGRALFKALAAGQLIFIVFFVPLLAAPRFAGERESETLDLLISSPVSIVHITLSKIAAPLLFNLLILISGMPVLALCLLYGGLSITEIFQTYGVLLTTVLLSTCLGMMASTLASKVSTAIYLTAAIVIVFLFIIPFHGLLLYFLSDYVQASQILFLRDAWLLHTSNHGLQFLNPFLALYQTLEPSTGFIGKRFPLPIQIIPNFTLRFYDYYLITNLLYCGILLSLTCYLSSQIAKGKQWWFTRIKIPQFENKTLQSLFRDRTKEWFPDNPKIERTASEILERGSHWTSHPSAMIRISYVGIVVSFFFVSLISGRWMYYYFILPMALGLALTLPGSAARICSERLQGTLDLIRTTLMPMRDYVFVQKKSCFRLTYLFVLALFLPNFLCWLVFGEAIDAGLKPAIRAKIAMAGFLYPFYLIVTLWFYTSSAFYLSAKFRKPYQAVLFLGGFILITWISPLFSAYQSNSPISYVLCTISPLTSVFQILPYRPSFVQMLPFMPSAPSRTGWDPTNLTSPSLMLLQCIIFAAFSAKATQLTLKELNKKD